MAAQHAKTALSAAGNVAEFSIIQYYAAAKPQGIEMQATALQAVQTVQSINTQLSDVPEGRPLA